MISLGFKKTKNSTLYFNNSKRSLNRIIRRKFGDDIRYFIVAGVADAPPNGV